MRRHVLAGAKVTIAVITAVSVRFASGHDLRGRNIYDGGLDLVYDRGEGAGHLYGVGLGQRRGTDGEETVRGGDVT